MVMKLKKIIYISNDVLNIIKDLIKYNRVDSKSHVTLSYQLWPRKLYTRWVGEHLCINICIMYRSLFLCANKNVCHLSSLSNRSCPNKSCVAKFNKDEAIGTSRTTSIYFLFFQYIFLLSQQYGYIY